MINIAKIGVEIALTGNALGAVNALARGFLGLDRQIGAVELSSKRMRLALGGMAGIAAGGLAAAGFIELAKAGGKLLDQQQKMLSNGTTQRDLALEMAAAYKMVSIGGSSLLDNVTMVADLRQLLGGKNLGEAIKLAPTMMKAGIAAGLMTGVAPETAAYKIAIIEDRLGYTVNRKTGALDPQRAGKMANTIDAIISGTNGRVKLDDLMGFAQQALATGKILSDTGLINMVPVIQAMNGQKAGTALTAFDKAFVGGVMTQRGSGWLERLGLINPENVHKAQSGYVRLDPNAIVGSSIMGADPQGWANTYLMPALRKAVGPNGDLMAMLTKMLQSGFANTNVRILSDFIADSVQNAKEVANVKAAGRVSQYTTMMQGLSGAGQNFRSALFGTPDDPGGLITTLGLPAAKMAVTALNGLAVGIRRLTQYLGAHPGIAVLIDKTLVALAVGLTALGAVAVGAALIGMVGSGGTLALVAGGIVTVATALTVLANALPEITKLLPTWMTDATNGGRGYIKQQGAHPVYISKPNFVPPPPGGHMVFRSGHMHYIQDGQALPVVVVNADQVGKAAGNGAIAKVKNALTKPQTGSSTANYRSTPSGSAAAAAR